MAGPCGWTVDRCGCGTCWDGYSPATRTRAATLAAGHMWAATGRRYGPCEITVRLCNPGPAAPLYQTYGLTSSDQTGPYIRSGTWYNGGCGGACTCTAACETPLDGPVAAIVEVVVAGSTVDPAAYEVHDGYLLVRIDGSCWPNCAALASPADFVVTYERGEPIPDDVQAAAEALACQYAAACTGGDCALPQNIASLSRQGVDIQFAEVSAEGGDWWRTGAKTVDDVIELHNPRHLPSRQYTVLSPDVPQPRMVTTPASQSALVSPAAVAVSGSANL